MKFLTSVVSVVALPWQYIIQTPPSCVNTKTTLPRELVSYSKVYGMRWYRWKLDDFTIHLFRRKGALGTIVMVTKRTIDRVVFLHSAVVAHVLTLFRRKGAVGTIVWAFEECFESHIKGNPRRACKAEKYGSVARIAPPLFAVWGAHNHSPISSGDV